ncbi:hypothetical protein Esti_002723 [Eimeria stiedai]
MKTATPASAQWSEQGTEVPVNVTVQPYSPPHAVIELPAPSFSSPPVRSKRFKGTALAAVAFILSGVALLFMCKRLSRNLVGVGLAHRRLAKSDEKDGPPDDELNAILNECLALEAEHGEPPSETEEVEPAAKKAKLVALLEEAASSYESKGQQGASHQGGSPQPPTSADELQWLGAARPSGLGLQSAGEIWLDARSSADFGAFESTSSLGLGIEPNLDPEAFLEQIPSLIEEGGWKDVERVGTAVSHGGGDGEVPSTSSALLGAVRSTLSQGDQQLGPEGHPFFRLPVVLPGAVRRELRRIEVYPQPFSGHSPFAMLLKIRELLLQPTLRPAEVEELTRAAEALVCFALNHPSGKVNTPTSPCHAVRHLGMNFLVLDCLVCIRQLLGPRVIPDQWWSDITGSVFTSFEFKRPSVFAAAQKHHNYRLLTRLIPASQGSKILGGTLGEWMMKCTLEPMDISQMILKTQGASQRLFWTREFVTFD